MREWNGPDLPDVFSAGESQLEPGATSGGNASLAGSAPGSNPGEALDVGPIEDGDSDTDPWTRL
jgi:hypothetical protein